MSAIFISYAAADAAEAKAMRDWLESRGHTSVFLDFDADAGIAAGSRWEEELYARLRSCRALLVLCSEQSMASKWVFTEVAQARALGKSILPVKVSPCEISDLITDRQAVDLTSDRATGFARIERGLAEAGIDAADLFQWDATRPPYPGMLAFHRADAAIFFGRSEETTACLDLINRVRRRGLGEFALLLGSSGSGKSSLLRAGVIPRLERDPERWLVLDVVRPRADPARATVDALRRGFGAKELEVDWHEMYRVLTGEEAGDQPNPIVDAASLLLAGTGKPDARVVLPIDQFEEMLGLDANDIRVRFLSHLRAAVEAPSSPLVSLCTMRSDFLGSLQAEARLDGAAVQTVTVGRMSRDRLTKIIEEPARVAGLDLESGLSASLVAEVADGRGLPLLAFALRELYERRDQPHRISLADYRDRVGGLEHAVARVANDAVDVASLPPGHLDALRRTMLGLVRVSHDGQFARRTAAWDNIDGEALHVVERLVEARLLVSGWSGEERTLEVAHEELFRSWDLLASWLDRHADDLKLRRDLVQAAHQWDENGRSNDDVWRGARLERAEELREAGELPLEPMELQFVEASAEMRDLRQRREEERRRRRLRTATVIAAVATLLSIIAGASFYVAQREADRANEQTNVALARQAEALTASNPPLALAVAAEAHARAPNASTAQVLVGAKTAFLRHGLTRVIDAHSASITRVAFDEEGERMLTVGADDRVLVWNSKSGELQLEIDADGEVRDALFRPGHDQLATITLDGTVALWEAVSGKRIRVIAPPPPETGWQAEIAFDRAGQRMAVQRDGVDGVVVFDVESGDELATLRHERRSDVDGLFDGVNDITFSPNGVAIATAGQDGVAKVFDAETGELLLTLPPRGLPPGGVPDEGGLRMQAVEFNWDGSLITTAIDNVAYVWATSTGERIATLRGHSAEIRDAQFADIADVASIGAVWESDINETAVGFGTAVVTTGVDGTVRLFNAATGEPLFVLSGSSEPVNSLAYDEQAGRVAAAARDGRVHIWHLNDSGALFAARNPFGYRDVRFDPTGTTFSALTGGFPEYVESWDANDGTTVLVFTDYVDSPEISAATHDGIRTITDERDRLDVRDVDRRSAVTLAEGEAEMAAFSADGTVAAMIGESGHRVLISEADSGAVVGEVALEEAPSSLALDLAGERVAVGFDSGAAHVFETQNGTLIAAVRANEAPILGLAFSPVRPHVVTAGADGIARIWDAENGTVIAQLAPTADGDRRALSAVAFNADGSLIATMGFDATLRVWDGEAAEQRASIRVDPWAVWLRQQLAFSPDGTLIAVTAPSETYVYSVVARQRLASLSPWRGGQHGEGVAFNDDGTLLATVGDEGVTVWDVSAAEEIVTYAPSPGGALAVAFDAERPRFVAIDTDGTTAVFNVPSTDPSASIATEASPHALLGDGSRLVTGDDETVTVWDIESGEKLFEAPRDDVITLGFDTAVIAAADGTVAIRSLDGAANSSTSMLAADLADATLSPDGSLVVAASGVGRVEVWDVATGEKLGDLVQLSVEVEDIQFSGNSSVLAVASGDDLVRGWDLDTMELIWRIELPESVGSIELNERGTRMLTTDRRGMRMWDLAIDDACSLVSPVVTSAELIEALAGDGPIACTSLRD